MPGAPLASGASARRCEILRSPRALLEAKAESADRCQSELLPSPFPLETALIAGPRRFFSSLTLRRSAPSL